ncbi:MAG: branched-chain amino acid ABC transporter permease [Actinomycetota bacterium]|nr:branched-chain amino acid ABC transporter permease [Actinomycetota bacterium]
MATATEVLVPSAPASSEEPVRWRPDGKGWAARIGVLALIFGGILYITAIVPGYWADRIAIAVIYVIIGLSLNVVLGYLGQVSLGHHAFVGIAAFVAAYYVTEKARCAENDCSVVAFMTAMAFAAASGAVAAGLLGLVALRIRGLYLALITLAYGFMAERSLFEIAFLTNSGAGQPAPRPDGFTGDRAFAFLCFAFLALVIFLDWRLVRSKVGRAILSLKHSEPVAASYGINVTAYKTLAFVLSGIFAGVGGGLYAFQVTNVVSNLFQFQFALLWVLMVVIGGLGNRTGVVIGSAFFALFPFLFEMIPGVEHFLIELGRTAGNFTIVIGSLLALVTLIQYPGGIAEQISPITRWLRGEKFAMHPEGHGPKKHGPKKHGGKGLRARLTRRKESAGTAEPEPAGETPAMSPELVEPVAETSTTEGENDAEPPVAGASDDDEAPTSEIPATRPTERG